MQTWDQKQPIYQQLADLLAARLLDGEPPKARPCRRCAPGQASYLLNPLTVNRALQALGDEGLLENRRGLGMFVRPGARERLRRRARALPGTNGRACANAAPPGPGPRTTELGGPADERPWSRPKA
jgi:GntR family transcriptional regulator